jgi:hypothetical protein
LSPPSPSTPDVSIAPGDKELKTLGALWEKVLET